MDPPQIKQMVDEGCQAYGRMKVGALAKLNIKSKEDSISKKNSTHKNQYSNKRNKN